MGPSHEVEGYKRLKTDRGYVKPEASGSSSSKRLPPDRIPAPPPLPSSSSSSSSKAPLGTKPFTDKDGHYIVQEGQWLNENYRIVRQLGEGTFSKVVECVDKRTEQTIAVKVIRAIKKYTENAIVEMRILRELMERDREDRVCFIKPHSQFTTYGHMCIVFKKLGLSLYDFLKKNKFRGFSVRDIRDMARSTLHCINFCHGLKLIHTDLKPENILLEVDDYCTEPNYGTRIPNSTRIRIIDFGSSIWEHQHHSSLIQTRHYRAPEVIVGIGWSAQYHTHPIPRPHPAPALSLGPAQPPPHP